MINNERRCNGDGMVCIDWQTELGQAMCLLQQQIQSHKLNNNKLNKEQRDGCWTEAAARETESLEGLAKVDKTDSWFGGLTSGVEGFLSSSNRGPSN